MIAKLQSLVAGDKFSFVEDNERKIWYVDYIELQGDLLASTKSAGRMYHLIDDTKNKKKVNENSKVIFI